MTKLLQKKPSDRISVHDALRHVFFVKNGLLIEQENPIAVDKPPKPHQLGEIMRTIDHKKLEPKQLPDSDLILPPDESQIPRGKSPGKAAAAQSSLAIGSAANTPKKQNQKSVFDDSLELSQSIILTKSQLGKAANGISTSNQTPSPISASKMAKQSNDQSTPLVFSDPRVQEAMLRKGSGNQSIDDQIKKMNAENKEQIEVVCSNFRDQPNIPHPKWRAC